MAEGGGELLGRVGEVVPEGERGEGQTAGQPQEAFGRCVFLRCELGPNEGLESAAL